ncbi:MAG: hypothetical protein P1P74_06830 [Desulfuromonadales bacterium]|nr:hypothetical protein [Desulfuromonadales bacterium]
MAPRESVNHKHTPAPENSCGGKDLRRKRFERVMCIAGVHVSQTVFSPLGMEVNGGFSEKKLNTKNQSTD